MGYEQEMLAEIQDAVQKLAGTYLKDVVSIVVCEVDSVDQDNRVCDCTPIGGDADTQIPSVQLCAENDNGLLVYPSVGSTVIVGLSTRNTAFVLMYSAVDNMQFMDGSFGGIPKLLDPNDPNAGVLARLNALEKKLNAIFARHFDDMGAGIRRWGSSAQGIIHPPLSMQVPVTVRADIENTKITQGI